MPDSGVALGQVLDGRYRIERPLGTGGVGEVYLGRHQRTGRPCAIKFLSAEGGLDPSSLRRFEREARALGSLGHPGIVGIHDFAETPEGVPYLVMDYLEGEDLAQRLHRDGAMGWETTKPLFREMAHALHAAHCSGVLHRDLKPGNVFVARTLGAPDRAVLLDFGLAKANGAGLEELSLTRTGAVFGTPLYMSPEQARGARLDQRSDLYSLATILFEMLAGRTPYLGESLTQLVSRLLLDPVPELSNVAPQDVPAHLDGVLGMALAKAPEDRYPDVAAFASAVLEEPLTESWMPAERPIPMTLAATLPSDPPGKGAPEDSSPSAEKEPRATGPAPPEARSGAEPRYDGSLAVQVTLESGDLPIRPMASDEPEGPEVAAPSAPSAPGATEAVPARDRAVGDSRATHRRSSTSWMLNLGILLLGLAAAAGVFWLVIRRGAAEGPSSAARSKAVSPLIASRDRTSPEAPGDQDAMAAGPLDSGTPVDAGPPAPRVDSAAPSRPLTPPVLTRRPRPRPMPTHRTAMAGASPARRAAPRPLASRPRAPDAARTAPSPGTPAMGAPVSSQKIFTAGLIRGKALKAEQRGKGRECLALLDKADRIHPGGASTFRYLRGWCLMRAGRCAGGRRMLVRYYQHLGTAPVSSKAIIQWAENAKCPMSSGSPQQQLARVHQRLTTACAMGALKSCGAYVRKLRGLMSKLPRPYTAKQKRQFNEGFMRAAVRFAKAGRCRQAWRLFQRSAAGYYGNSPRGRAVAQQWLRAYGKGCPTPPAGP